MKQTNIFLTHSWESEYNCVGGFQVTWLLQGSKVQILFFHPPLPDMPHPSVKYL